VEDYLSSDPRQVVHFRAHSEDGDWNFRVHPGTLEDPLRSLQGAVNYAEALDPVLMKRLGFGIGSMLEIAGRMLDRELSALAPAWSSRSVSLDSQPEITDAEVAATAGYLRSWSLDDLLSHKRRPAGTNAPDKEQLALAADALTVDSDGLSFGAGPDQAHLGPVLFVRNSLGAWPVPSALIGEGLMAAVTAALRLLPESLEGVSPLDEGRPGQAAGSQSTASSFTVEEATDASRRWRDRARSDFAWACRGVPVAMLFGELADDSSELLLICPGQRHVVAVELVTGLTVLQVTEALKAAESKLAGFGPGSLFQVSPPSEDSGRAGAWSEAGGRPPDGTTGEGMAWFSGTADAIPFPPSLLTGEPSALAGGTEITRLIVVEGPWHHGPHWIPGIPACTLDEFRSLLSSQDWEISDREELWAFLDELTSLGGDADGRGFGELFCWSILDAWDAWRAYGMLSPAWLPAATLGQIRPRDHDFFWERDAALDRVDALLARFGMAGVREWSQLIPAVIPDPDGAQDQESLLATLWIYHPRKGWWVSPDEELIVTVDLDFHEGFTFSRATVAILASTVADTLRELARTHPRAWDAWRQAHGYAPAAIRITPARLPDDMPAMRVIILGAMFSQICVDPARLDDLTSVEMHDLIGDTLAFALVAHLQPVHPGAEADLREDEPGAVSLPHTAADGDAAGQGDQVVEMSPSDEDMALAELFREAWQSMPPRFVRQPNLTPFAPHSLSAPQTLSENGELRASRTIARRLRGLLAPGAHPLAAVLEKLCPGALDAIDTAARPFSARAGLAAACAEQERALGDRIASRMTLELNLGSPWADLTLADLDAEAQNNVAQRSRVAELLVESLLYRPSSGSLAPDRRDVHHFLDLATAALHASLEAQNAYAGLSPAYLHVSELGNLDVVAAGPQRAALQDWQRAQIESQAHAYVAQVDETPAGPDSSPEADKFTDSGGDSGRRFSLRAALQSRAGDGDPDEVQDAEAMIMVDRMLLENCGFGFDAIIAVLATVVSWEVPGEPFPPIAQVIRADLVNAAVAQSQVPQSEIETAVDMCTLTASRIQDENFPYWQLEQRSARLALRPLISPPNSAVPGELWLLPRSAHRTQQLLVTYLSDRRLPWPGKELPAPVRAAVRTWRKLAEDALEVQLVKAAQAAGLTCRPRLTIGKASVQNVKLAGEIDLLAADPVRRRIWVIEAKRLSQTFSPLEMASHIADFHGPEALALDPGTHKFAQFQSAKHQPYTRKILANAAAVRSNVQGALRLIYASSSRSNREAARIAETDWQVIGIAVTSHTEVAAFVADPKIPIVSADHLSEIFISERSLQPGWWTPWNQQTN
jgi:hypothetical protein